MNLTELIVLIKSGGEVGSGVAHKLFQSHFKVCLTEASQPTAVSRGAAFSEAIYDGEKEVEGVIAKFVKSAEEIPTVWKENKLPIVVDPETTIRNTLHPHVLVDAIMAKKNLGTRITDAPLVIGLGPGFQAGKDVHLIVETNNSENLGKVIFSGEAEKNTGVPIPIAGLTFQRVIHSPQNGLFVTHKEIGDTVNAGDVVASVGKQAIKAPITGLIRALLHSGVEIEKGTKLLEIDPEGSLEVCHSIRARMRTIAGGVLEAILFQFNK